MSNQIAIDVKGAVNFACSVALGSRPALRLLKATCNWFQELAEKTYFTVLGYDLDVIALNTNLLKPLDKQIYIIKGISEILDFPEKCLARGFTMEAVRHAFKTVGDSAAGLRCLALFGVVVLTPYTRGLGLTKNVSGLTSGLLGLAIRIRNLVALVHRPLKNEEDVKKARYEWLGLMLMVGVSVCSIQLSFFALCKALTKDIVKPENQIPGVFTNLLRTGASICNLGNIAVEYYTPK